MVSLLLTLLLVLLVGSLLYWFVTLLPLAPQMRPFAQIFVAIVVLIMGLWAFGLVGDGRPAFHF